MATTLKRTVVSLLLLSSISQGVHGVEVFHRESLRAEQGQNITLPCLLKEKEGHKPLISQVEWRKKGEPEDHILVVFNPNFGKSHIWPNITLEVAWDKDKNKDKLLGTSLVLKGVEAWDSGRYICDITTYPNGSIRKVTRLKVEGPASTDAPPVTVSPSTWPTLTGTSVTEPTGTPTGTGTVTSVTESTGTGTVTSVTEPTGTGTSVTSDQTEPGEMATPTANLSVTADTLTTSAVQEVNTSIAMTTSVAQLINSSTHRSVNTEARPKGSEVNSSTDSPIGVPSTVQSGSTYPPKVQSDQPTPWSVQSDGGRGNESEAETSSGGGQEGPVSTTLYPEKSTLAGEKEDLGTYYTITSTSTASHGDDVIIETGQRYVVWWILLPVLVLLLLVGFLYRRYIIQKRMDLPPPFKPPPPPVKYSSLRAHDVPMTDILT